MAMVGKSARPSGGGCRTRPGRSAARAVLCLSLGVELTRNAGKPVTCRANKPAPARKPLAMHRPFSRAMPKTP